MYNFLQVEEQEGQHSKHTTLYISTRNKTASSYRARCFRYIDRLVKNGTVSFTSTDLENLQLRIIVSKIPLSMEVSTTYFDIAIRS